MNVGGSSDGATKTESFAAPRVTGRAKRAFLGCTFPAHPTYRNEIHNAADLVGAELARAGVIGRFSVDFVSVHREEGWKHYELEVNLRKGDATLPYLMLKFLTGGVYDVGTGIYTIPTGQACVVGIGHSQERAAQLYQETVAVRDRETEDDLHIDFRDAERQVDQTDVNLGAVP